MHAYTGTYAVQNMGDVMAFACDDEKEKTLTEQLLTNSLRREHEVNIVCVCECMHACIHTYIHAYIHAYIHTA
jgi:hypothetical protein